MRSARWSKRRRTRGGAGDASYLLMLERDAVRPAAASAVMATGVGSGPARSPQILQIAALHRVNDGSGTELRWDAALCDDKRLGVTRGLHAPGALYIFGELSTDRLWGADWCGCLAEKW